MMRFAHSIIGGILVAATLLPTCHAEAPSIYKIEEDWEMVINEPDPASNSPQITFYTSPTVDSDDVYFQLQMNYAADASTDFSQGGFHVAAVQNEVILDEARSATRAVLSYDSDQLRWTSVMAVLDGRLLFAVKDGQGTQWGSFGGPDYLVRLNASPVVDLSAYHPRQSLEAVDIGFGANRVASITLVQTRVYYTDGRMVTVVVNGHP